MKKLIYTLTFVLFVFSGSLLAQEGQQRFATYKSPSNGIDAALYKKVSDTDSSSSRHKYFGVGILTTTTKYPTKFGIEDNPTQKGAIISAPWHISTIEEIQTSSFGKMSFNIGAEFSLGFALGDKNLKFQNIDGINPDSAYYVKNYTVTADLFSMNINMEYVAYAPGKRTLTAGIALTFLNIGGAVTYMKGGVFDKKVFGIANIIPLYIQPYGLLKLSGASIGIGVLINPYSFLEVKFGPKKTINNKEVMFFDSEASLNFSTTQIAKYALNFFVKF